LKTAIPISGNVQYAITLDPSVWIFDDRRIDLEEFFNEGYVEKDELEEYKRNMGKHWSREIMEGAVFPPTLASEKKFEESKEMTGTYGIYLNHFLKNAQPKDNAEKLKFELADGTSHSIPLAKLDDIILKYSIDGKPILEDGPIHVLFKDGSNIENPIRNVIAVTVE